jgi:hypothetical protein
MSGWWKIIGLAMLALTGIMAWPDLGKAAGALTPIGAEKDGNKDGAIPPWEGGAAVPPAGWKVGDPRPNPYKDEKKLFSIDATNVDKYKDKLAEGQIHLIKSKRGYRMDVYTTHRSCAYPQWYYDRTAANVGKASVDGAHVKGVVGGAVPFPDPRNGIEVIWNFKLRYQGEGKIEHLTTVLSNKNGDFNSTRQINYARTPFGSPKVNSMEEVDASEWQILNQVTAPPARNGEMILVLNYIDRPSGDAWLYFPGQRRVRRAPTFAYDNPVPGYENLEMVDQYPMYAGSPDRYDWKLVGKQEIYVPYNSYEFRARRADLHEIYGPEITNRDLMRYELHRVWKVEGTVKDGMRHNAAKRVFYIDEDSWQILHADLFDAQGKLWRIQEGSLWVAWELPACVQQEFVSYDLSVDRYIADNVTQNSPETDWLAGQEGRVKANLFDPGELRRQGER